MSVIVALKLVQPLNDKVELTHHCMKEQCVSQKKGLLWDILMLCLGSWLSGVILASPCTYEPPTKTYCVTHEALNATSKASCRFSRGNELRVISRAWKWSQILQFFNQTVLYYCASSKTHQLNSKVNLRHFSQITTRTHTICQGMVFCLAADQKGKEVWLLVNSDDEALLTYAQQVAGWSLNGHYLRAQKYSFSSTAF